MLDVIVQIGGAIVRVSLALVAWPGVIWHARQAGMMSGQIEQSNFRARRCRSDARRKTIAHGIVKVHLSFCRSPQEFVND